MPPDPIQPGTPPIARLLSLTSFAVSIAINQAGGGVVKLGDFMEISSMALAAIIGILLRAALPDKETAGDKDAILSEE